MASTVRIDLFATARDAVGRARVELPVPSSGTRLATLLEELGATFPKLRPLLKVSKIARGDEYLKPSAATIHPGDHLAVHPPFSGG